MHVALTGASGFIGSNIARQLASRGHTITALVRPSSQRAHIEPFITRFVTGDHADQSLWPALLDGADCVIHNSVDWKSLRSDLPQHLRSNLLGSLNLLHASDPTPFIFISSIAVHHDMKPRHADDRGVNIVDEDHPLRPSSPYGAYKAAVEAHLWAQHFASGRITSCVRPCAVYGLDPQLHHSHGYTTIQQVARREPFTREGGGKMVHVEDVALAVVSLLANTAASGQPYNLVDCYTPWSNLALWAGEILGIRADIRTASPDLPRNMFDVAAARSLGVQLNRGHDGIKSHLRQLVARMRESGAL